MCRMVDLLQWLVKRTEEDMRLYEQYGKPLEATHRGEYVAIGSDGQTILGKSDLEVLERAVETLGSGNFALMRVGHRSLGRWLSLLR
jgi:hypothetical protein